MQNIYMPAEDRYEIMKYNRSGRSGLILPAISLGLWHNFGGVDSFENGRAILRKAFDKGITHFDLANNYGPPYGSAEDNFGQWMKLDFKPYRNELIISSKAGYDMWPGPYGNWGSRKYLISSCDASLKKMGLDYVDIFYHHRPDPETPLEETMLALDHIVRSGRALYVGVSNYPAELTQKAYEILKELRTPFVIHQPRYSMLDRWVEEGLLDTLGEIGVGSIVFSPLCQGVLTNKYLKGIPEGSRASKEHSYLKKNRITDELIGMVQALNAIAENREQTLAQMSLAWLLKDERVTSVLIGASSTEQLVNSIASLNNLHFEDSELRQIGNILGDYNFNRQ